MHFVRLSQRRGDVYNMTRATIHSLRRKMQPTSGTLDLLLVGSVRLRTRFYLERRSRVAAVSLGKWTTRSRLEAVEPRPVRLPRQLTPEHPGIPTSKAVQ